jgi:hypothetical protein
VDKIAISGSVWLILAKTRTRDNDGNMGKMESAPGVPIPVNLATDFGVNWPPVGAKRRWLFILLQGGRHLTKKA